ncbi:Uma2 family endonuclease [Singulisphaera rosea]
MATTRRSSAEHEVDYPTSDGKPMAETDIHRRGLMDLIETLEDRFADDPMVYVSGNLLLYYEEGNKRRYVSPDVFVARGVPKLPPRERYLLWEEGKGPDLVIEVTSRSTRLEDQNRKRTLYGEILKVTEYFLFDPTQDYLKPAMQGFRLMGGEYEPIEPVDGRLQSVVLGLHLERAGLELRLHDPASGRWLPTPRERAEQAEAEAARLRLELEALRRRISGGN